VVSVSPAPRTPEAAPGTPGAHPAQPTADVTVLTTQDDFLLELGAALSGQAAVHPVDSLDDALAGVAGSKRTQVLVIDARAVADVPAAIDRAHAAHPRLPILVFADAETKKTLADLRKEKQFAVLATPIDAAKTRSVLERAITAAVTAKAAASPAPEVEVMPAAAAASAAAPAEVFLAANRSPFWLVGGAALLLAIAAGVGYWLFHASAAPPAHTAAAPAPVPVPVADTSILKGKVDELLEKARLAMHERRFAEPTGDNALLYYRSALAADSGNAEARDGLTRVAGALASRFDEALSAGRFDEAALTLANFKVAAPADARLSGLEQRLYAGEIARALADGNIDRASAYLRQAQQSPALSADLIARWRAEIARHQEDARVQQLASQVEEHIRDGRLLDGDDSAKAYLGQLTALAASNPATDRVTHELIGAYLRRAREAALAKNNADEERWLGEARALGMKPAELAAFQKDLAGARQKAAASESEHTLQLARQRLQEGHLTDPAQDSAAYYLTQLQTSDPANAALADAGHALAQALLERARTAALAGKSADADLAQASQWGAAAADVQAVQQLQAPKSAPAVDPATLAASLKRTRTVAPDYPPDALSRRLAGSVTLQFTVDRRGEPRDIHVLEASPPGIFDQAAIYAVRGWRYQPLLVNGAAVEVPVTTRVRFELPK
jgi:TonB family protein